MKLITVHNRVSENTRYYKVPKTAGTVVLEQPDPEAIIQALQVQFKNLETQKVSVKIGASFLHHSDQLNKKVGRKLAIERMKELDFEIKIHDYNISYDALWVVLQCKDESLKVHYAITCKIYKNDRKLRVMGVSTWGGL